MNARVCLQGETAVASSTNCPEWNEEISFIEQFPPLAQRIGVQILDDAKTGDVALATHFLDLQQISDPTRNGTLRIPLTITRALEGPGFKKRQAFIYAYIFFSTEVTVGLCVYF